MTVTCTQGRDRGSKCTFACTAEAELDGLEEVTCEKDGQNSAEWSSDFPKCQREYQITCIDFNFKKIFIYKL